jgi:hypothetical protein
VACTEAAGNVETSIQESKIKEDNSSMAPAGFEAYAQTTYQFGLAVF